LGAVGSRWRSVGLRASGIAARNCRCLTWHVADGVTLAKPDAPGAASGLLVAVLGVSAASVSGSRRQRPLACAELEERDRVLHVGFGLLALGAGLAAVAAAAMRRPGKLADATDSKDCNCEQARLRPDVVSAMASLQACLAAAGGESKLFPSMAAASGSSVRTGLVIEALPDEYSDLKALFHIIDSDDTGKVVLAEFMALAALSSLIAPRRRSQLDMNGIVFGLFAAVDDDCDGQLSAAEGEGLCRVLQAFDLLAAPAVRELSARGGAIDLSEFRACCRRSFDVDALLSSRRKP